MRVWKGTASASPTRGGDRGLSDYKVLVSLLPQNKQPLPWFQPLCLGLNFLELQRPAELFPEGRVGGRALERLFRLVRGGDQGSERADPV